jgi:tRNA pseudouridine32 synthase / 23S rRNA pseudouridine746 synthase
MNDRQGVGASVVVVSEAAAQQRLSLLQFLAQRFTHVSEAQWQTRFTDGEICDVHGASLDMQALCEARQKIFYYRSVAHEVPVPFEARMVFANEHIVIADKPHFLPVTPSGHYVKETLLARLKHALHNEALVPVHRIDRDTAGLVMFSLNPATRGAYHALFSERRVKKVYEAIAPFKPELTLPLQYASRLEPAAHFMQMCEVPGVANAFTHISLLEQQGAFARYQLKPITGKRHQLRVQMHALGIPICNDGLYPVLTPERAANDFSKPLLLLAKQLAFDDPITGERLQLQSQFSLNWPQ